MKGISNPEKKHTQCATTPSYGLPREFRRNLSIRVFVFLYCPLFVRQTAKIPSQFTCFATP